MKIFAGINVLISCSFVICFNFFGNQADSLLWYTVFYTLAAILFPIANVLKMNKATYIQSTLMVLINLFVSQLVGFIFYAIKANVIKNKDTESILIFLYFVLILALVSLVFNSLSYLIIKRIFKRR